MPGRAKSERKKKRDASHRINQYMDHAVTFYQEEQYKVKPMSLRKICNHFEDLCFQETGKKIKLSDSTLDRRVKGGRSHAQAHEKQQWLNNQESDILIEEVIYWANRGFPLDHKRLKEHADEIARARHGDRFPEGGVGKNWTERFVSDHHDQIGMYWSRSLDHSRARAVNPYNHKHYFKLLGDVIKGEGGEDEIPAELIYGADESGLQKGIGQKTRVIGKAKKSLQHQQRSGDRENITVIVTICGDGTSTAPAVIYKGEGFQMKWRQNNPLNASLGYSKTGYTNGEIGRAWIENFDKETRAKARGRRRLLIVDGHVSHYTRAFLQYAREHRIDVIGYPSHATHVYQGLDVVIFSPMKKNWTAARDHWEREGHTVDKSNFLSIYAKVHQATLTKANIKAAFQKTGVIPFNPAVVTTEMMAPSETSSIHQSAPVRQPTPVRLMTEMVIDFIDHQAALKAKEQEEASANSDIEIEPARPGPSTPLYMQNSLHDLQSTSAGFLIDHASIKSTSKPPSFIHPKISPTKPKSRYKVLLDTPTRTRHETHLHDALLESEGRDNARKDALIGSQAGLVLSGVYVARVNQELRGKEEKANKKGKKRLLGDGKAKFFSGDEFYTLCINDEQQRQDEAEQALVRREAKNAHGERLAEWKKTNKRIKEQNDRKKQKYEEAVTAWEVEKAQAKVEKRRPGWSKPKWKEDFQPEKLLPRPKKPTEEEQDGGDGGSDSESSDSDEDGN